MQTRVLLGEEINHLRRELMLMSAHVQEDLGKAITVLRSGGEDLVKEVKANGMIVDALQFKIEDMALILIATQQPVARDLREMYTVFKLTQSLERVGDYAIHLAIEALRFSGRPPFRSMERIERMAKTGQEMLKEAMQAYITQDPVMARMAAELDDKIDAEHKELTEEIFTLMKEQPHLVKSAANILKLSGYMERMGDHITNMCEGIIYMTEGKHTELNN